MKNKKIIFFDIDGTIISEDKNHKILKSTKDAIKKLRENGHLTFINTGRTFFNVTENIRSLGFDGYVCGCGTHIIFENNELLYKTVPYDKCVDIKNIIRSCDASPLYERKDGFFYDKKTRNIGGMEELKKVYRSQGKNTNRDAEDTDFGFDKFCMWYDKKTDMNSFQKEVSKDFEVIDRENCFAEMVPVGFSKGTGIEFLAKKLNFDIKDTFAFGDSLNDLPMIKTAGTGVSIGSNNLLAEHADYISEEFYDDGLAKAIKQFELI